MNVPTPPSAAPGQVCDRCRLKKVKCDGANPACKNCMTVGVPCVTSARLRRKTKIRGFQSPSSEEQLQVRRLQAENDELKQALAAERETSTALRIRLEALSHTNHDPSTVGSSSSVLITEPIQVPINNAHVRRSSASAGFSGTPRRVQQGNSHSSATVVKHMGRMVSDARGGERFSGSTSGVHFLLSVQQVLQARRMRQQPFPESCFYLHLLEPTSPLPNLLDSLTAANTATGAHGAHGLASSLQSDPLRYLDQPFHFYTSQIDIFVKRWGAFCPIVASTDLAQSLSSLLVEALESRPSPWPFQSLATVFQICIILVFNSQSGNSVEINAEHIPIYLDFVHLAIPQFIAKGDLTSLHGLILYSFYLQVSNQPVLMVQTNGVMVRLSQSLGLHRHSRRFKLGVGQIEMRKRMWWYIYMFDKLVSIVHGLPKLINDEDVDVDCPLDCDLDEIDVTSLSFPLPGETTLVSGFTSYVHLSRILSSTLGELYTTTRRRKGVDKIVSLHTQLQAWKQRSGIQLAANASPDIPERDNSPASFDGHAKMRLWLSFMANITMMLIHRPALTFDPSIPQFSESLKICREACSSILGQLGSPDGWSSILGISPAGPSLILQCSMMHIFHICQNMPTANASTSSNSAWMRESSEDIALIDQARGLLAGYNPKPFGSITSEPLIQGPLASALAEITNLLESLCIDLERLTGLPGPAQSKSTTSTSASLSSPSLSGLSQYAASTGEPHQQDANQEMPSFDMLGDLGALDYLNHPAGLNWIFDDGAGVGPGPIPE